MTVGLHFRLEATWGSEDDLAAPLDGELSPARPSSASARGSSAARPGAWGASSFRAQLPGPIDPDAVEANLEDGVLTVRVRKPEQTRPRRVEVHGPTNGQGTSS
jgi:HSP20 family protein